MYSTPTSRSLRCLAPISTIGRPITPTLGYYYYLVYLFLYLPSLPFSILAPAFPLPYIQTKVRAVASAAMSSDDDDDIQIEAPELAEDDPMRAFLPASFGKKSRDADVATQIDRSRRTVDQNTPQALEPRSRSRGSRSNTSSGSDGHSDNDSDSDEDEDEYPTSHEMVIKTHERAVTTVSLDPAGGRLISGSIDCTIKLHDFSSMTPTTIRAFKSVDPFETKRSATTAETHPINHVEFNPLAGGVFLCVSAHPQAKIMTRDGDVLAEFVKGDMYLRDMNHTKGHVSEVTTGTWHPTDKNICVTAGTDSTLRIWDINNKRCQKEVLVFKSKAAGTAGRSRLTSVAWGTPAQGGNNILVSAALDGTLVMWSGDGPFSRPTAEIREAHQPGTWTGGIDVSPDGRMVVTRGGDNLIKLWDTRKFKQPLVSVEHQSTSDEYSMTNIKYGPNATSIITGSRTGHLHILNPGNLQSEYTTPVTAGVPLITVDWHSKINQIVTGSANGETHVLYNPTMSTRGAVDVMSRAPKRRHVDDNPEFTTDLSLGLSGDSIITPGAMPGARGTGMTASGKSKDPRRPQIPQQTPFMRNQPDEKHISENIPLSRMLHEDPREALLKYASVAEKDRMFTNAWKDTQPVTQYADVSDEEEAGPKKKKIRR
ncbi:WD repeat domain-containing protein [Astrocystis sublimbata]|nr:WD repeat domain-containing protein [Astrocystis sublimbata]